MAKENILNKLNAIMSNLNKSHQDLMDVANELSDELLDEVSGAGDDLENVPYAPDSPIDGEIRAIGNVPNVPKMPKMPQ